MMTIRQRLSLRVLPEELLRVRGQRHITTPTFRSTIRPSVINQAMSMTSWTIKPTVASSELDMKYRSVGLADYTKSVAQTVAKNLTVTGVTGALSAGGLSAVLAAAGDSNVITTGVPAALIVTSCASLYHAFQIGSQTKSEDTRERHSLWMHGLFGASLAPSLIMFSPYIPEATIITGALVAGSISSSLYMKESSLLPFQTAMHTGLWGIVVASLASLVAQPLGFPALAAAAHSINLYGGLGFFTLLTAYDTHVMIADFKEGRADRVGHAASYSLNTINIFLRVLEIFSNWKRNE